MDDFNNKVIHNCLKYVYLGCIIFVAACIQVNIPTRKMIVCWYIPLGSKLLASLWEHGQQIEEALLQSNYEAGYCLVWQESIGITWNEAIRVVTKITKIFENKFQQYRTSQRRHRRQNWPNVPIYLTIHRWFHRCVHIRLGLDAMHVCILPVDDLLWCVHLKGRNVIFSLLNK